MCGLLTPPTSPLPVHVCMYICVLNVGLPRFLLLVGVQAADLPDPATTFTHVGVYVFHVGMWRVACVRGSVDEMKNGEYD